jgi:hypothetical protein
MNSLTERLCHALSAIPEEEVSAQGARLMHHVWSRFPKGVQHDCPSVSAPAPSGLTATGFPAGKLPVETAAFNNAFRFATECCAFQPSQKGIRAERACLFIPVFSATALAEARATHCQRLFYAIGLGIEAHGRLVGSLASSARRKGFDPEVLAATFAAIVACAAVERLPPDKVAQALGLGCSAITAVTAGYLPLQAAMAARDGIAMVLLVTCGFRAPPDALACRWGVYEAFADPKDASSLDLGSHRAIGNDSLQRLLGSSTGDDHELQSFGGSVPVQKFVADVFR